MTARCTASRALYPLVALLLPRSLTSNFPLIFSGLAYFPVVPREAVAQVSKDGKAKGKAFDVLMLCRHSCPVMQ